MITVLSTNAVRGVLGELLPGFERASGSRVAVTWSTTAQTIDRIERGGAGDAVIATAAGIARLERAGKVRPGSAAGIGSSGIGVAVRRGAPKPAIDSPAALRQALLAAASVAWTTMGASGMHFERLLERLQIADAVRAKAVRVPGGLIGELLARNEAELGVQMVSEILAVPGAELVAPLPPELQNVVDFAAGVLADAGNPHGAADLIRHLTTPDAVRVLREKGFDVP